MNKTKKYISFISSLILILLAVTGQSIKLSHAGFACKDTLGTGLSEKSLISSVRDSQLPTVGSRVYTVDELFSNSYDNAIPIGIIEKGNFIVGENDKVKDGFDLDTDQEKRLKSWGEQNKNGCLIGNSLSVWLSNSTTSIGQSLTSFVQKFPVSLFSNDFVCNPNHSNNRGCLNILGIIGGESDDDKKGLISIFGNGFFIPLQTLAFLLTGMWILYKGIIKREFRASLNGFLWGLFALFLGMIVILNPYTFARFPQLFTSAISECLMGAMTGNGCTVSSSSDVDDSSVCSSSSTAAGIGGNSLALRVNGLACGITKAFTIDRWSIQQFGYSFDELWTQNPPTGYDAYTKIEGSATDYCVNMGSSQSPNQMTNYPTMTSEERCNVALAFLAKKTNGDFGVRAKMNQFVLTAAKDDVMWSAFTGQSNRTVLGGIFSNLGILLSAIAFIPVTVYAHAYSLSSTILMAFAPLFFLFAIHPGKGKKIFLGWLEAEIGSIMKYGVSAMLTLVMILMFGSALASMTAFQAFLAIIILDVTFLMYRKEFVNLVGNINLGGEKVANKAGQALEKVKNNASQYGKAGIGGLGAGALIAHDKVKNNEMIGAKHVIQSIKDFDRNNAGASVKNILATTAKSAYNNTAEIAKGASGAIGMEARRGNGVVATGARQYQNTSNKLKSERERVLREQQKEETARNNQYDKERYKASQQYRDNGLKEELKGAGFSDLNKDLTEAYNKLDDTENLNYQNDQDGAKLNEVKSEINVKVERNQKLIDVVNETGGTPEKVLAQLSAKEAVRETNKVENNVEKILAGLKVMLDDGKIDKETYSNLKENTLNLQTEIFENTGIRFEEDLANSLTETGEIDAKMFHEAWDTFDNNHRRATEQLSQLGRLIQSAYSEDSKYNKAQFDENDNPVETFDTSKFANEYQNISAHFNSFENDVKKRIEESKERTEEEYEEKEKKEKKPGRIPPRPR